MAASAREDPLEAAARAIAGADAMVVGTGAGMGVDSGIGTFRGRNAGVWQPLKAMQVDFTEMSCPAAFEDDPGSAWAFWKYRHDAYTQSEPHKGYKILSDWGANMAHGVWSVTSNIDGHWARTPGVGEERTFEMHGALTHMQRMDGAGPIWPTDPRDYATLDVPAWDVQAGERVQIQRTRDGAWVDDEQLRVGEDGATIVAYDADGVGGPVAAMGVRRPGGPDLIRVRHGSPLPTDASGAPARPNVLMFGDGGFNGGRIDEQEQRYTAWLRSLGPSTKLVVVEVGAGTAVPTIRGTCQGLVERWAIQKRHATLVRINLDQSDVGCGGGERIAIGGMGALEALEKLDARVRSRTALGTGRDVAGAPVA